MDVSDTLKDDAILRVEGTAMINQTNARRVFLHADV